MPAPSIPETGQCNDLSTKTYHNSGNQRLLREIRLLHLKPELVLDVGCGAGDNARHLQADGWTVDGITLSSDESIAAKTWCRHVWIHNLENGLPGSTPNGSYRIIVASHVLEHICYPAKLLRDCYNELNPQGYLLVALPNLLFWKNRMKIAAGYFTYEEYGLMDYTHFRWYTFQSAQALLQNNGFYVEKAIADGYFPLWKIRHILPNSISEKIDRLFSQVFPGLASYQMIFVARRNLIQ